VHQIEAIKRDIGGLFEVKDGASKWCNRRPLDNSPVGMPGELPPVGDNLW
jgi:hypothetical protein